MSITSVNCENLTNKFLSLGQQNTSSFEESGKVFFEELLSKFNLSIDNLLVSETGNIESNVTDKLLNPEILESSNLIFNVHDIKGKEEILCQTVNLNFIKESFEIQDQNLNFNGINIEAIEESSNMIENLDQFDEVDVDNFETQNNEYNSSLELNFPSFLNKEFQNDSRDHQDDIAFFSKNFLDQKTTTLDEFEQKISSENSHQENLFINSNVNDDGVLINNITFGLQNHSFKINENYKKIEGLHLPVSISDQLKVNLNKLTPEENKITVYLSPNELGSIDIEVNFNKNVIQDIKILVENIDTYHLLKENSDHLKVALTSLGYEYGEAELSFNLEQNKQQSQQEFSEKEIKFYNSKDITEQVIANLNNERSLDIMI